MYYKQIESIVSCIYVKYFSSRYLVFHISTIGWTTKVLPVRKETSPPTMAIKAVISEKKGILIHRYYRDIVNMRSPSRVVLDDPASTQVASRRRRIVPRKPDRGLSARLAISIKFSLRDVSPVREGESRSRFFAARRERLFATGW